MNRFTLYIPEHYNDGVAIDAESLAAFERRLLEIADGFTMTHGVGAWKGDSGTTYHEPVRLYAIDADAGSDVGWQLRDYAVRVARTFEQEAVYLTSQEITVELIRARD